MKKHVQLLICSFFAFMLLASESNAQVAGVVFRDFNANGLQGSFEPGATGVFVNAYDNANNIIASFVSNQTGIFSIPASGTAYNNIPGSNTGFVASGTAVRVEFVLPSANNSPVGPLAGVDFSSAPGNSYGSSVQFITAPAISVNFALHYPGDYVGNTNPITFIPCYVIGDPLAGGNSGTAAAIVSFPYDESGTPMMQGGSAANPLYVAPMSQVGATYGTAYSRQSGKLFASAFLKRHVGLGPLGGGGIYMADPNVASSATNFLDLDAIGIATSDEVNAYTPTYGAGMFSPVIGSNSTDRGLGANVADPNWDQSAFNQVGRVSLGGLDISDDGQYLYVMNLYDRTLYQIDLTDPTNPVAPTAGNAGTKITGFAVPDPCSVGEYRPFAVRYFRGSVYVGVVCDGTSSSGATREDKRLDMKAVVYRLNLATTTWTNVLEYSLNYPKGSDFSNCGFWSPWWSEIPTDFCGIQPSPILSDIEIDVDGALIMAFMDRTGNQVAEGNGHPSGTGFFNFYAVGGDMLRAYFNPLTNMYELEANAKEGPSSPKAATAGANNGQGPPTLNVVLNQLPPFYAANGHGEFYYQEHYVDPNSGNETHKETVQGGLGLLPGLGSVMVAVIDPLPVVNSGGVSTMSNHTGAETNAYQLYRNTTNPGSFNKANGLGEPDVVREIYTLLEIGNRVWADTDGDGIQDAGEAPMSGVTVQLLQGATVIATATTDANGNYFFSNATGSNTASVIYGITQLQPNMSYIVRIPNVQGGSKQAALGANTLTTANAGGGTPGTQADVRDSDGVLVGNNAEVTVLTTDIAAAGANNHNFDFGFMPACTNPTATASVTQQPTCTGTTSNNNGTITVAGFTTGQRYQYSAGTTFNSGTASPATITTIPAGGVITSTLVNTTQLYTVRIYDATDDACFVDRVVTVSKTHCGTCDIANDFTGNAGATFASNVFGTGVDATVEYGGVNGFFLPDGTNVVNSVGTTRVIRTIGANDYSSDGDGYFAYMDGDDACLLMSYSVTPLCSYEISVDVAAWDANGATPVDVGLSIEFLNTTTGIYQAIYSSIPVGCAGFNTFYEDIGDAEPCSVAAGQSQDGFFFNGGWGDIVNGVAGNLSPSNRLNWRTITFTIVAPAGVDNLYLTKLGGGSTSGMAMDNICIKECTASCTNPILTALTNQTICQGGSFTSANVTTSVTNGVAVDYQWYNNNGAANPNMDPIGGQMSATLTALPTAPGVYAYRVRAMNSSDPTCFADQTVTLTILATPTVNTPGNQMVCHNTMTTAVTFTGTAARYDWTNNTPSIGLAASGTGNIPAFTAMNTGASNVTATITVTPRTAGPDGIIGNADDCIGTAQMFTITVTPRPAHGTPTTAMGTCSGSTANNDASITIPGITNGNRIGISTAGAASYDGPSYTAPATTIVGGTHTFTGLMHNTQYTIRIFNGADNCFTDVVVTTASIACCTVTINSSTPTACVPATNTYSLTVNVSWANASGTTLTVTTTAPGATPQTITTTAGSSGTQSVTFTGLTANATMYNVTAQFGAGCTATTTNAYTAPPSCAGCPTGNCGSTTFTKRT